MAKKMVKDDSLNALKKAFKILDTDGSGSIDASEFREVMSGVSQKFTPEELNSMIKAADTNNDNTIDEKEFINCMRTKKKSVNNLLLREM